MSSSGMAQASLQLPAEIWTHIFGYLSPSERFSVRTCSKLFMNLADHPSLWEHWTVALSFKSGSYNSRFWSSLQRRKIHSVMMRSSKMKDWGKLTESLPGISTLILDHTSHSRLDFLRDLPHLTRLVVRDGSTQVCLDSITVSDPLQLTHLTVCGSVSIPTREAFVSILSKFTNLTSLVCHGKLNLEAWMIYRLLAHLPKLKHLSLSCAPLCSDYSTDPAGEGTLSSLELLDFSNSGLPEDAMRCLQGLTSLAVYYGRPHYEFPLGFNNLKSWLGDLPKLSTLVVGNGPPVMNFVSSIPASVTSLTLSNFKFSHEDMEAVALQVPNLLHLHMDPFPSYLGAHTADIPRLFPNLKSLKLHHQHVREEDFLLLHKLQHLEHLEILDNHLLLPKRIAKFQAVTQSRLHITTFPSQRDVPSCRCVKQLLLC